MKRILYYIRTFAHRRVFESYAQRSDVEQLILGPKSRVIDGVMEDYSTFGIQNIKTYGSVAEAQKMINKFKPNVLVQADFPNRITLPAKCKRVFASHGLVGNHVKSLFASGSMKVWKDFDLYCGAGQVFEDWISHITGKKQDVLLNALAQFDLLNDPNYYNQHKDTILSNTKNPHPSAVILFCGFCCKNRADFNLHNEDYFKTLFELEKIAKKHNWLVIVKPRQTLKKTMKYLKATKGWADKYREVYSKFVKRKNLHFIGHDTNIYKYFFSDVIVCNGCSTLEIEACLANKPLALVRTKSSKKYDPFGTIGASAAQEVKDVNKLEATILRFLQGNPFIAGQDALIKSMGIIADGQAHKRIQDRLSAL